MHHILEIATLICAAIAMGLALAHALERPGKMRLSREEYLAVQPIYHPGFTYAGSAEPLTILLLITWLVSVPHVQTSFWILLVALITAVLTQAIYWIRTAPLNHYWLAYTRLSRVAGQFFDLGPVGNGAYDWQTMRERWEDSHVYRAMTATITFLAVVVAVSK